MKPARMLAFASCGAMALTAAVPGLAQDARSAATTASDAQAEPTGDEIIVTAQRRTELARDVPLSITTKSGEELERAGVVSVRDLTTVVPGLKFDTGGAGFVLPAIRGITTNISTAGAEANVATYVDGVYQTSQLANTFDLPDVSRLEVAKGPQGTLFGRNATGGAIQVFTRAPSFTPTGDVTVAYGRFDDLLVKGFVSAPIVADRVAFSVSGFLNRNDGYLHDVLRGRRVGRLNSRLVRGKLLVKPTDRLSVTLAGQYMDRRDDSSPNGQALNGNTVGNVAGSGNIVPTEPYDVALSLPGYSRVKARSASLTLDLDTDLGTIRSISAYQHSRGVLRTDTDFSVLPRADVIITQPDTAYTQEVVFSSNPIGPVSFIAGTFYIDHEGKYAPLISNNTVFLSRNGRAKSIAVFGEATVTISDRLTGIAGLRYSHERSRAGTSFGLGAPRPIVNFGEGTFDSVTPRLSLRYALTDSANAYVTYSKGFKSGGADTASFTSTYIYKPEKVDAYEAGIKTRLAPGIDVSGAAFLYNYKDQQQLGLVTLCLNPANPTACSPSSVTLNAASSRIYGLEAEGRIRASSHLDFATGLSLLHARYRDFPNALVSRPRPAPTRGNVAAVIDASGNHLTRAPDFTLSVTANYRTPLGDGELVASASGYHSSRVFYDFEERVRQPAYTQFNARIEYQLENGLAFAVFGKNLTDEVILQSVYINDAADGVSYAPPRTWGVSASYRF